MSRVASRAPVLHAACMRACAVHDFWQSWHARTHAAPCVPVYAYIAPLSLSRFVGCVSSPRFRIAGGTSMCAQVIGLLSPLSPACAVRACLKCILVRARRSAAAGIYGRLVPYGRCRPPLTPSTGSDGFWRAGRLHRHVCRQQVAACRGLQQRPHTTRCAA